MIKLRRNIEITFLFKNCFVKGCFIKCQHFHHALQICGSALFRLKWAVCSLAPSFFNVHINSDFLVHVSYSDTLHTELVNTESLTMPFLLFLFSSLQYFLWIGSVSGSYESLWISTCINEHDEKGKIHPSLIITSHITGVGLSLCFLKESADDGSYSVKTHKSPFIHDVWSDLSSTEKCTWSKQVSHENT